MVFLCTPAQTHIAPKSAFLLAWKGKRGLSLSLSLSLFCSCRRCCCSNASRVVRFESEEKRKKKKTIRKKIFARARKGTKYIIAHSFRFFLSLSFSFSPVVVVVVVAWHHPERERERERCAHLFKNDAPRLSFRETYLRVLSLCSFAAALNIFYSFSSCRESG